MEYWVSWVAHSEFRVEIQRAPSAKEGIESKGREKRLTRRSSLKDIAADFALLRLQVPELSAARAGSSLNS